MNKNNIGRFQMPLDSIKNSPDAVAALFREMNFVPLRAEIIDWGHCVDYIGLSDKFRETETGSEVPYYSVECKIRADGGIASARIDEVPGQETPVAGEDQDYVEKEDKPADEA